MPALVAGIHVLFGCFIKEDVDGRDKPGHDGSHVFQCEYTIMNDWSARQYLKFEDDRTRPSRDLLAQVPLDRAARVFDLGCGPGNSTELLIERFPNAEVIGLDSSSDMLRQARERLPGRSFVQGDLATWSPPERTDLLFGNAVFQWVPDHRAVLARLVKALPQGGVLAVQMPDNTNEPALALMREVAERGPYAGHPALEHAARGDLPTPGGYYDLLRPLASHLDVWYIVYNHVMAGPQAIVEWFKGSALRPFLDALEGNARDAFLADYTARIAKAYPACYDGKVLLRFPRLFIMAVR
jgi:trans-aconitate 2-methyltransferase